MPADFAIFFVPQRAKGMRAKTLPVIDGIYIWVSLLRVFGTVAAHLFPGIRGRRAFGGAISSGLSLVTAFPICARAHFGTAK